MSDKPHCRVCNVAEADVLNGISVASMLKPLTERGRAYVEEIRACDLAREPDGGFPMCVECIRSLMNAGGEAADERFDELRERGPTS